MTDQSNVDRAAGDRGTGEKVKDAARQAQEKVSDVAEEVRDRGEDMIEEGKDKAHEMADRAGDAARSRADDEKDRVAGGVRTVADALRRGGEGLPEDRQMYGRFVEGIADRMDDVSRYLEQHDVNDLTRDVRRFARDHTPVFLGGAFMLGMVGARFVKSSPDAAREDEYRTGGAYGRAAPIGGETLARERELRDDSFYAGRYPTDVASARRPVTRDRMGDEPEEGRHAR